ncbi:NAD(P)-dependent oxidoreductase, partial [Vibrio harveyi]|uniref:NAD(P)-dependent oxidoreductase n=1 Tax=Vibrio harveyi TaxID=669 RepID=UPI0024554A3B
ARSRGLGDVYKRQDMMGADEFARMKPGSIFINAARGTVVDIDSLCSALESKHIAGAAIDVFPIEPKTNNDPFESPLMQYDNVCLLYISDAADDLC